jgi:hypothetical protein
VLAALEPMDLEPTLATASTLPLAQLLRLVAVVEPMVEA